MLDDQEDDIEEDQYLLDEVVEEINEDIKGGGATAGQVVGEEEIQDDYEF